MKEVVSSQQIVDAAGDFSQTAASTRRVEMAQFDASVVPSPSYTEVATVLEMNGGVAFGVSSAEKKQRLGAYPGLRVVVDLDVPSRGGGYRQVSFPGIVLEQEQWQLPRVGYLASGPDAMLKEPDLLR